MWGDRSGPEEAPRRVATAWCRRHARILDGAEACLSEKLVESFGAKASGSSFTTETFYPKCSSFEILPSSIVPYVLLNNNNSSQICLGFLNWYLGCWVFIMATAVPQMRVSVPVKGMKKKEPFWLG
jgi:hypothetical protein